MIGKTRDAAVRTGAAAALALSAALPAAAPAHAAAYPNMAPIAQYLMADRNAEIAMARSAAPPALSGDATVLVLGRRGYETAIKGKNGFVCLVERGWTSPFDSTDFWNPRLRGPVCYNPPAAQSVLPFTMKRTALALAGQPKDAMLETVKTAVARKELGPPEPGSMSYMMSRQQYLGDSGKSWMPHLMFHVPTSAAAAWGANLPGSPIILDTGHKVVPEPQTIFMTPAAKWSDGTPFAAGDHHH
jgi:hypothetical protein